MTNASANQTEPTKLTQATYDRLVAELEDLTTRGRVEIAQAIEAARALGDLSENGDYHAAKDAQGKMESRIRQLQAMLKEVEIVDESGLRRRLRLPRQHRDAALRGRRRGRHPAVLRRLHRGAPGRPAVISPSSPLGQVLVGQRAGDAVEYKAPGGMLKVHIVAVER